MAGPTVYKDVAGDFGLSSAAGIFAGKKFWVAQRVPSRTRLLDDIKANGGEIVILEKAADYRIADHFRTCPPGTTSYTFVETSIEKGELQDPADHPAGPPLGEAREPGSIHQPTKSGRTAYTAEEDSILYKWVRDAEAAGARVSGNEIYKQLEAKHPRHTWQSWRDRYHKQLKNRPPSAFNIPDNAPPSPPSDQSNERVPPAPACPKPVRQQTPQIEQASNANNLRSKAKLKTKGDFSVDELEVVFSTDDWLELYAFVDLIESLRGTDEYESAWAGWAEQQGQQTVEQWQQYYEKAVHPQWLADPISKREKIKRQMERKHEAERASGSQSTAQQSPELEKLNEIPSALAAQEEVGTKRPPRSDDKRFAKSLKETRGERLSPAYTYYALEKRQDILDAHPALDCVALHELLLDQWRSLSAEEKSPYIAKDKSVTKATLDSSRNPAHIASDIKVPSSSTASPKSPNFYEDQMQRFTKRLRENDFVEQEEEVQLAPPTKRRKNGSATPTQEDSVGPSKAVGTQNQPVEISSAESSQSTSQSEDVEELIQEQIRSEALDTGDDDDTTMVNLDEDPEEKEVESIESDDLPDIDRLHPSSSLNSVVGDDLPSNTPTPHAARQKVSNFDTQAILSSPTQDNFPQPYEYTNDVKPRQELRSPSPFQQPQSDASTTQSLEEFRRSLQEEEGPDQDVYSQLPPQPLRLSSSPAPSSTSSISTGSGDPDPPMTADETIEFYKDRNAEGWSDDYVSRALKRTRMRPELAVRVLEAWKDGNPLPINRGIWSIEDDDAVEGGDGLQLARLAEKHSVDGWGGVMERLKFLESYRNYS